jgi:hypothetical protein
MPRVSFATWHPQYLAMAKSRRYQLRTLKKAPTGAKYEPTIQVHYHNDLVTGATFVEIRGWVFYLFPSGLLALWTLNSIASTLKAKNLYGTSQGTFSSRLNYSRPPSLY